MKKYICLNHGECNWADEQPPREFTLPDDEESVCPNCKSANIREAKKTKANKPWLIPVLAVGLLSGLGLVWWAIKPGQPELPLKIEVVGLDCKTGILSLTTTGGDGSPVIFTAENLSSAGKLGDFFVPADQRSTTIIRLSAVQSTITSDTTYRTNCSSTPPEPPRPDPSPIQPPKIQIDPTVWTLVEGSGYCDPGLNGTYYYTEQDNLGRTRERKITDPKCYPAEK